MACFVAVHGAFRGGWWWREVRLQMQAAGHEFWAPSLTGAAERSHATPERVSLATWVDDVARLLEFEDLTDVVLVGHSQGGVVTTAASQQIAPRLAQLVYLDAPVPHDGERAADFAPAPPGVAIPDLLNPSPVSAAAYPAPLTEWINARLTPAPSAPAFDPVRLDDPAALAVPRTYAFCERTPEFFPCWRTRRELDALGTPYQLLPAGHDVALSDPGLVVRLLQSALAR